MRLTPRPTASAILTHASGVRLLAETDETGEERLIVVVDHPEDGIDVRRIIVGEATAVSHQELEHAMDRGKYIAIQFLRRRFLHWTEEFARNSKLDEVLQARKQSPRFTFRGVTYENDMPVVSPRTKRTRQTNPAARTGESND